MKETKLPISIETGLSAATERKIDRQIEDLSLEEFVRKVKNAQRTKKRAKKKA